jgi:hypothetical protein
MSEDKHVKNLETMLQGLSELPRAFYDFHTKSAADQFTAMMNTAGDNFDSIIKAHVFLDNLMCSIYESAMRIELGIYRVGCETAGFENEEGFDDEDCAGDKFGKYRYRQ